MSLQTDLLRPTTTEDLAAIHAAESSGGTRRWLGDISTDWHTAAMEAPDIEHLTVVDSGETAGFVVLASVHGPDIELRRIVVFPAARGLGLGRRALAATVDRAFVTHRAGSVWLDVKRENSHARALYESSGFAAVREIPDAVAEPDGSRSTLVVLTLPHSGWQHQRTTPT